jgi:hypothetical protein
MAKHWHLVLDLNTGETESLALPVDGGGGGGWPSLNDFRRNVALIGPKNGSNLVFTSPDKFVRAPFIEVVFRNGVAQEEGASNDYVASESVIGAGYDTITFTVKPPLAWEKLTIDYLKP